MLIIGRAPLTDQHRIWIMHAVRHFAGRPLHELNSIRRITHYCIDLRQRWQYLPAVAVKKRRISYLNLHA